MSLILLYYGDVMLFFNFFNVAHQLVLMRFESKSFSLQQKTNKHDYENLIARLL